MCEVFYTMKQAIAETNHHCETVIFAKEVGCSGKRIFVGCTKVDIQRLILRIQTNRY